MALSIWGAITGTIGTISGLFGLWLRFRQHGLDKAELVCTSSFGFESPSRSQHKITIRSTGRRPVTVDAIQYFMLPPSTWKKVIKRWLHRRGRYIFLQEIQPKIKLSEGEKADEKITLHDGVAIQTIYKAEVIDQTGKHWPVKWPSLSSLSRMTTVEQLDSFESQNESSSRICSAVGYRLGEKYYLEVKFNTIPSRTGVACCRSFSQMDMQTYSKKYKDIKQDQHVRFLAAEIDEIT